jgi:hypothetical protein
MADLLALQTDAVTIPRAELQVLLETLASLTQASGQAFSLLIDRIDDLDGDPDLEDDDPSGQCDEDGINTDFAVAFGGGPGCKISDPGEEDDPAEDNHDREQDQDGF